MTKHEIIDDENTSENIENSNEIKEEAKDIHKAPAIATKKSKIPSFPQNNQVTKWGWFNNFNNKQRPGRAASRWR